MTAKSNKQPQIATLYQSTLYRVVFQQRLVKFGVGILLSFFLLQPALQAYAFELSEEATVSNTDTTQLQDIQPIESESAPESSETESDEITQEAPATNTEPEPDVDLNVENEDITAENTVLNDTIAEQPLIDETVVLEVADSENSTTTLEDSVDQPTEIEEETATTSEPIPDDTANVDEDSEEDTEVPTPSPADTEIIEEEVSVATTTETLVISEHNSHEYQFNTDECAIVGDGAYYCSAPDESEPENDGVFALQDGDGDMEIFVRVDGQQQQITFNSTDDSAPYYDAISERIVWHSVVNDRYQIVSYDMDSNETTFLTNTSFNNMEPVAHGDITLWQAWIDNNWEILMQEGDSEPKRLTENDVQDVSPHMRGEYVVWQTQFTDGWQVAVFDQTTGSIDHIDSEGGLKVENPRFVLVYDSTNEVGDRQTIGYDFDNKKSFTLNSIPADLPDELPEPDQTGETRALIQNKQSPKEGENEIVEIPPVDSGTTSSSTATSTVSGHTLDLSSPTTTLPTAEPVALDIVDVVIPSYASTSTSSQEYSHIIDVVIPPQPATTTEEVS